MKAKRTSTLKPQTKLHKTSKELDREALIEFAKELLYREFAQSEADRIVYATNVLTDIVKRNMICSQAEVIIIIKALVDNTTYCCGRGVTSANAVVPKGRYFID